MRIEAILWTGTAVFFAVLATAYLAAGGEAAGVSLLVIAMAFAGLVGAWLWAWVRSNSPRAEDRAGADMADETGELGTFVTHSTRPFMIAGAASIMVVGLAIGPWLAVVGLCLLAFQIVGLVADGP